MLTKEAFVLHLLGETEPVSTVPTPKAPGHLSGFNFEDDAPTNPADGQRQLILPLFQAAFGDGQLIPRDAVIRSADAVAKHIPDLVRYWPKTPTRPHQTLLIETNLSHRELLSIKAFKSRQSDHLDIAEDALARVVAEALEGFQRGAEGLDASALRGQKDETLCVVSIKDERDGQGGGLACFGTFNAMTGGLEHFFLSEHARAWDRADARERLGLIYERQFKQLGESSWQEAFTTSDERKQADNLLSVCTKANVDEKEVQEAILDLLDTIAKGFGLPKKTDATRRLRAFPLPGEHDIGIDSEERESRYRGVNPFSGVMLRDDQSRLLGYIVYPLKTNADAKKLRQHLERHNRFHNVLVVYPDANEASIELWQGREQLTGKLRKGQSHKTDAADVVNLLSRFFIVSKAKVRNPDDLAQELAYRARYLRRLALHQLCEEPNSGPLRAIFRAFTAVLAHDQTEEDFADAYAQTLTYGLLAARWLSKDEKRQRESRFTRQLAANYLPATSPFLRDFFRSVLQAGFEGKLAWLLDDIAALLDRTDVNLVFSQHVDLHHALSTDPIIHFYEPFLEAYDADQRRDRGVYYTPDAVVRYMVAAADRAVKEASPDHASLSSGAIRVIDPATGTGTFLREVLRYCGESAVDDGAIERVVQAVRGLEVMVAPYAICHLRLALALHSLPMGAHIAAQAIHVHLADTLEAAVDPPPEIFKDSAALASEAVAAKKVKDERIWTLVIGNPPYKNNSSYTLAQIAGRFPALLKSSRDAAAVKVRNIRDDYAWFFAAADSFTASGGAVCFVTSDSYLKKDSYRHFRRELIKHYQIVRITRLGQGVFVNVGPRIGFAIIMMIRRLVPLTSPDATKPIEIVDASALADGLAARDLGTPRDPRIQWLLAIAENDAKGRSAAGIRTTLLRPTEDSDYRLVGDTGRAGIRTVRMQVVTKKGAGFDSIFVKKWPGIITAFDCLLKAETYEVLAKRMRQFFDVSANGRASDAENLAQDFGFDEDQRQRLEYLSKAARTLNLSFDTAKIKPVFAGSIPAGNAWSPPLRYAHWVYYEPLIKIPRNTNPGKDAGWGWMQQWRDPETHEIFPKLIFTTSTNPNYGFRAYVIGAGWYTKLHGAASQQYHYVMLDDPTKPARLGGGHNNLTTEGEALLSLFRKWDLEEEDLLHWIAAFYNSHRARVYVSQEADSMLPLPELRDNDEQAVKDIVGAAKRLRDLRALQEARGTRGNEAFPAFEPSKSILRLEDVELAVMTDDEQVHLDDMISEFLGAEEDASDE
jgi:type I restriction-modification system DNA methylase subunit